MALCPFATIRLLPAARSRPVLLRPTQIVTHTMNATLPATDTRFRRPGAGGSARGRSHFGVADDGTITQWIDTSAPGEAAYRGNLRSDGTGAISVTTEGHVSQPWTDAQLDALVRLHRWLMRTHPAIARRICRSAADPGLGHHVLFGAPSPWTPIAKSCPGPFRVEQWRTAVVPRTLADFGVSVTDMRTPDQIAEAFIRELVAPAPSVEAPVDNAPVAAGEAPTTGEAPAVRPAPDEPVTAPRHHGLRDAVMDFFLPDSAPHNPRR